MLMCCIINIQPNGFPDFPSATLYYMNFFVNFQTNNTKYFQMCMEIKTQNTKNLRTTQGCKMSSPAKGGSQPCGWQIASSRDSFCDFGRKLETLSQSDYYQIEIEFLIFGQRKQNNPGLMQFATYKTATPPLAGELIAPQTTIWQAILNLHF